jgi:RNA polymerase sigma factor (TIGR02999 family)
MSANPDGPGGDITDLLQRWSAGDKSALDRVLPLVYEELRRIAARQLRHDEVAQSVDPTELVHALYLQLAGQRRATWLNRTQFFAIVAQMMRRILVDHARARATEKRGGTALSVPLASLAADPAAAATPVSDVLAIDRALERLAARDPEQARLVELRFFAGLSIDETAHVLDRSPATIKRSWRLWPRPGCIANCGFAPGAVSPGAPGALGALGNRPTAPAGRSRYNRRGCDSALLPLR